MNAVAARLLHTIRAALPGVADVSIGVRGDPAAVRVFPADQQAAAQPAIDAFDWSPVAQAAWEEDQVPQRKALRQAAQQALDDNAAYLALPAPTAVQVRAQLDSLTRQANHLIRRVIQID